MVVPEPAPVEVGETPPSGELPAPVVLAFAARSAYADPFWTPIHPTAEVVVFIDRTGWPSVTVGETFTAIGASGRTQLTYAGTDTGMLGCDGGSEKHYATFEADAPLQTGVYLLVEDGNASTWTGSEMHADVPTETARKHAFGEDGILTLTRTERMKAQLVATLGGKQVFSEPQEKYLMDGAEDLPINLTDVDIGMPQPLLHLDHKGGVQRLVLETHSYEGLHFSFVEIEKGVGKVLEDAGEYIYWCAF